MFEEYDVEKLKELLKSKTKEQILTIYNNRLSNLTKKQLIILALRIIGLDYNNWQETKRTTSTGDKRGQLVEIDELKDILGNKIGSIKREWTYYPREIFEDERIKFITTRYYDANGIELIGQGQEIEHLEGGEAVSRPI